MCTETFLRLPEEKRGRFLDAAWEEFTTVSYTKASVNQIVSRAGIPRGSFYQYFADKNDLMAFLLDEVRDQCIAFFRMLLSETGGDIFRATLLAYDRLWDSRERGDSRLIDRWVKFIRINRGIDVENVFVRVSGELMAEDYVESIDLSRLRRQDRDFALRVSHLVGMSLGGALAGSVNGAERKQVCRQELAEHLDIIRRGSLREDVLREGGICQ